MIRLTPLTSLEKARIINLHLKYAKSRNFDYLQKIAEVKAKSTLRYINAR